MRFDHGTRLRRLQASMEESSVDVVLLSVGADLPYLTGYEATQSERLTVLVARRDGEPVLLVPRLEAPRVQPGDFELRPWDETEDPVGLAALAAGTPSRIAVGDRMWSAFLLGFQRQWADASWVSASTLIGELRLRKDPDEIEALRQAAQAVDRAMARIPGQIRFSGRTERSVARDLAEMTVEEGHDVAEFTIVGAGPNGASPHHEPGDRIIEPGDLVVCDFGGRRAGYYSDSTRTFSVGEPTGEHLQVHQVVAEAAAAGREAVAPGVACEEIDRAAREVIGEAGFGEFFIHRTGHGIGLEVHEHPYIVAGNRRPLETGMAFSVEPGIYLPDRFGVRIEDIVVAGETGADVLNRSPRGLLIVE